MKIGILSMQKVRNYGSFLQGFALKSMIEGLGHECEFVDIEQGKIFDELKRTPQFLIKKAIERYLKFDVLTRIKYTKAFNQKFDNEIFDMLGVNKHTIEKFDTVVIGSDEVFNFAQRVPWGYTPQLYGKVQNANKVISYAGSFGHTTIDNIVHFGVKQEIADAMSSMSAVSVRDMNSFEIVKSLTSAEPIVNVDPVLAFDYAPYVKPSNRKDYIIIYTYPNRIKDPKEVAAIRAFAKKHGKRLISVGFYFPWCDETVIPDPYEVLGYIRDADYIVTDTFHGSVMSLKFNKKFASLVRSSNMQKMTSLLQQFGLQGRIVDDVAKLEEILLSESNYTITNETLAAESKRSYNYLEQNL